MGLFKRFVSRDALVFKNKLKYGEDFLDAYTDACERARLAYQDKENISKRLEEIYNFKKNTTYQDWSSFNISSFKECKLSPVGHCLYISYFGEKSTKKNDPITCLCCKKNVF